MRNPGNTSTFVEDVSSSIAVIFFLDSPSSAGLGARTTLHREDIIFIEDAFSSFASILSRFPFHREDGGTQQNLEPSMHVPVLLTCCQDSPFPPDTEDVVFPPLPCIMQSLRHFLAYFTFFFFLGQNPKSRVPTCSLRHEVILTSTGLRPRQNAVQAKPTDW